MEDLRWAWKSLARAPGHTLTVVLILALALGATMTVLVLIDSTLLRDPPFPMAERLVRLIHQERLESAGRSVSYPDFEDWKAQATSFDDLVAAGPVRLVFTPQGDSLAQSLVGEYVSEGYFSLLGATPILGRTFAPEETAAGGVAPPLILLSETLWKNRWGGGPRIIGTTVPTTDGAFAVVGVMPDRFKGLMDMACLACDEVQFWIPAPASDLMYPGWIRDRGRRWHYAVGRLKAGTPLDRAQREMAAIAARLEAAYPDTNRGTGVRLEPLTDSWRADVRPGLTVLLAAAVFVLLMGSFNVAHLLLARGESRAGEMALRTAMGASRARLIYPLLLECLLLALGGGTLGFLLTLWLADAVAGVSGMSAPSFVRFAADARVAAAAAAALSLSSVAAFGLVPSWIASRADLRTMLAATARGAGGPPGGRFFRRALVLSQVTFALALLINATLMIESFRALERSDPGFRASNLMVAEVNPSAPRYETPEAQREFLRRLIAALEGLPGVLATTIAAPHLPPRTFASADLVPEGTTQDLPSRGLKVDTHRVLPNFFQVLGIPLLEGRGFTETDRAEAPPSAVVSESLARFLWGSEGPVGKRIRDLSGRITGEWMTVVGVVRDVKYAGFRAERGAELDCYLSLEQLPARYMTIAARTEGEPLTALSAIRLQLREVDPELPILVASTVEERFAAERAATRFHAAVLSGFALTALALVVVGVYGMASYSMGRRAREVGIRLALGARPHSVVRMLVRQGTAAILAGIGAGMLLSHLLARAMASVVFGVEPTDAGRWLLLSLLLLAVGVTACYIPARRIARMDVARTLRSE